MTDKRESEKEKYLRELRDWIDESKADLRPPETPRAAFEREMRDWGICYADWAGGTRVWASDNDVVANAVYPDSGDWVTYDARGRTGFIGTCHDGWSSTFHVELKPGFKHDYDLTLPEIPRSVSTIDLMIRYHWIVGMFMNYAHREDVSPFSTWESQTDIDAAYDAEKGDFESDPHLALYWLLHFGLCHDARYKDIAAVVREHGHDEALNKIKYTLAFFDETDVFYDMPLDYGYKDEPQDFANLFLKRRANLLYKTTSYQYAYEGEAHENMWLSVALFPGPDKSCIQRMRWLANNTKKFDLWDAFDARLNGPEADAITYIAYLRALQPGRSDTSVQGDQFVAQICDTQDFWKARNRNFAQAMLWDMRESVSNIKAFETACEAAFQGSKDTDKYQDVLAIYGTAIENLEEKRAAKTTFEGFADPLNAAHLADDKGAEKYAGTDAFLKSCPAETLEFLAEAIGDKRLKDALLRHLFLCDRPEKGAMLLRFFPRAAPSDYNLPNIFPETYPVFVKTESDPTFKLLQQLMMLPDDAYISAYWAKHGRRSICAMLCSAAHFPGVFEYLLGLIETSENPDLPELICEKIFHRKFDKPTDPIMALNSEQVIRLLDTLIDFISRYPGESESRGARRVIYYCAHPAAIAWAEARVNNPDFYKPFESVQHQFETLAEELKNDLEGLLHWHEEENN